MSEKFIQHEHHGAMVWSREDLAKRSKEFCLCCECGSFTPDDRERNCPIANEHYAFCVQNNMAAPITQCPQFVPPVQEGCSCCV